MDYHTYYVGESEVLVHNSCTNPMTGTKDKASDVLDGNRTAGKSSAPSVAKPNHGQGFSSKGYNSKPGERTLDDKRTRVILAGS